MPAVPSHERLARLLLCADRMRCVVAAGVAAGLLATPLGSSGRQVTEPDPALVRCRRAGWYQAPACYQAEVAKSPSARGYVQLGALHEEVPGFPSGEQAVEAYRSALRLDPGEPEAVAGLGRSLLALGRPAEAFAVLTAAGDGARSPALDPLLRIAADAAAVWAPYEEARGGGSARPLRELELCVRLPGLRGRRACAAVASRAREGRDAARARTLLAAGLSFGHVGDEDWYLHGGPERTEALCREAIDADPAYPLPYFLLGDLVYGHRRLDEALDLYTGFSTLRPDIAVGHRRRAAVLGELGDADGEASALAAAARSDPIPMGSPETGQGSGLLLGVAGADGYRTLWVRRRGEDVSLAWTDPGLVVPTDDGFRRVGVVSAGLHDDLWIGPAEAPVPRGASSPVTGTRDEDGCTDYGSSLSIRFVGPGLISLDESSGSECNGHSNHSTTASVSELAAPQRPLYSEGLSVESLLPGVDPALLREAAAVHLASSGGGRLGEYEWEVDPTGWALSRLMGHWAARGVLLYQHGSVTYREDFEIPVEVPEAIVGFDRPSPPWGSIVEELPDADDAFSSPESDMTVVVRSGELLVFFPQGGSLGPPRARLPIGDLLPVVMSRWAVGRRAEAWDRELGRFLDRRPVIPSDGSAVQP